MQVADRCLYHRRIFLSKRVAKHKSNNSLLYFDPQTTNANGQISEAGQ